tara:strand:- start:1048 stop:1482 length:435 start_codon:yes stop_codon:yes gene_type:complete
MSEKSKVTSLLRLAKQFPPQLVSTIKKGNREEDYINHSVIAQRLLQVVGPYDWDFEIIYKGEEPIACKGTLTVDIDDKKVSIAGAGTPQNKSEDIGEQIKKMESDAFKRAASKIGAGLHLWAQDQYFLFANLLNEMGLSKDEVN